MIFCARTDESGPCVRIDPVIFFLETLNVWMTASDSQLMAKGQRKTAIGALVALTLSGYSCSFPLFGKPSGSASSGGAEKALLPARLSGVIERGEQCGAGYYRIRLTGLFDGGQNQVETESDRSGRFSMTAPPGRYLMEISKDNCGSRQWIELEDNTEHMVAVSALETGGFERSEEPAGRLPASILIPPKR